MAISKDHSHLASRAPIQQPQADFLIATPLSASDLESVIVTAQLDQRPRRGTDCEAEGRDFLRLTSQLAQSPDNFFAALVKAALKLSDADSTGISLLNEEEKRFVWPAVAGQLQEYLGAGTPSDFGPCGVVLQRQAAVLFCHPERHFSYLAPITPALEEVLLVPFFLDDKPVGTIWAVLHSQRRQFDHEDRRLLENLSQFAASAYRVLAAAGAMEPLLRMTPQNCR